MPKQISWKDGPDPHRLASNRPFSGQKLRPFRSRQQMLARIDPSSGCHWPTGLHQMISRSAQARTRSFSERHGLRNADRAGQTGSAGDQRSICCCRPTPATGHFSSSIDHRQQGLGQSVAPAIAEFQHTQCGRPLRPVGATELSKAADDLLDTCSRSHVAMTRKMLIVARSLRIKRLRATIIRPDRGRPWRLQTGSASGNVLSCMVEQDRTRLTMPGSSVISNSINDISRPAGGRVTAEASLTAVILLLRPCRIRMQMLIKRP